MRRLGTLLMLCALVGCGGEEATPEAREAAPALARVVKDGGAAVPAGDRVQARIKVPEEGCFTLEAGGFIWIAGTRDGLIKVDPETEKVVSRTKLPAGGCTMASDGERLYVEAMRRLFVVDVESAELVDQMRAERAMGLPAIGNGSVWFATDSENQEVTRFSLEDGLVQQRIEGVGTLEAGPSDLAAVAGAVWVGNRDGTLQKIDPATNKVVQTVEAGPQPALMVGDGGWLWFANYENRTMGRLDARAGKVVQTIEAAGGPMVVAGGSVWAIGSNGETLEEKPEAPVLWRLDAKTGEIRERLLVGRKRPAREEGAIDVVQSAPPLGGVAFADGSVWVMSNAEKRLYRLAADG